MKLNGFICGITFKNKDEIFTSLKPEGELKLRRVPYVDEKDPSRSDPLACEVWLGDTMLGFLKRGSQSQKLAANNTNVSCKVTDYSYATGEGDSLTFNDNHEGRLASVSFVMSDDAEDEITFTESNKYLIKGKEYARVSQMLDYINLEPTNDGLLRWQIAQFKGYDEYKTELTRLADAGTALHKAIEDFLRDGTPSDLIPIGFHNFMKKYNPKILGLESVIHNDTYGYAGTYDMLAEIEGFGRVVVDWKSASGVRKKHKCQIGVYCSAVGADHGFVVALGSKAKQGFSLGKIDQAGIDKSMRIMAAAAIVRDAMEAKG